MLVLYLLGYTSLKPLLPFLPVVLAFFEYVKWYVLLTHRQEVILLSELFLDWGEPTDPIEKNTVFIG